MVFQISAGVIMLVFYIAYYTKAFAQKKQGIKTNQIGNSTTGFVKFIQMTMGIMSFLIVPTEIISIVLKWTMLPDWVRIAGLVIAALGVVIFIKAFTDMGDSWRAGVSESEKTELVTTGIYKYSRNPAFLGFYLMYTGILLCFFNWILLTVTLFTIAMFHLQIINVEEDFLIATFREDYLEYRKHTGRYFGRRK